ncbi:hypothetical protein GOBAR_AA26600 [Gossypium barbadense]|uniref:Uncharacterized protein n=1 Tax=Gossypium barbadense TaxID=3634 RepID=A0A2P5WSN4_GOSBA|nr:hypothetical protein GOBAR_AA26600 [Gossypium barbadense]
MDLRVALMAQRKRPRIGTSVVNLAISNEEDTDSGRLELCCKNRVDHIGTFVIMITTSLSANSQTAACESSLVPTHSNSPPLSIPPFLMPPPRELPIGKSGESAPSYKNLNYDELQDIMGKWRASVSGTGQRKLCIGLNEKISRTEAIRMKLEVNLKVSEERWLGISEVATLRAKLKKDFYLEGSLDPTIVPIGDDTADTPTANNIDVAEGNEGGDIGGEECEGRENEVIDDQTKT